MTVETLPEIELDGGWYQNPGPEQLKLNPAFKAAWVTALRSKEFKQGEGCLAKDGTFCCLGVASEVLYRAGAIPRSTVVDLLGRVFHGYGADLDQGLPGPDVYQLAYGPFSPDDESHRHPFDPVVKAPDGQRRKLHILNDCYDLTFDQLADLIEDQL